MRIEAQLRGGVEVVIAPRSLRVGRMCGASVVLVFFRHGRHIPPRGDTYLLAAGLQIADITHCGFTERTHPYRRVVCHLGGQTL